MKVFWQELRQRIDEIKNIDDEIQLVWGAHAHKYNIEPTVNHSVIQAYEEEHSIQLPNNYITFLQYFGAGGAGPDLGLFTFPNNIWQGDLSIPLALDFYSDLDFAEGYIEIENLEGPLQNLDGMMRIGNAGQAQNYLVVTGDLAGSVICWDRSSGIGWCSGAFEMWYQRWVDCIFLGLQENEMLKMVRSGMHLNEIESMRDADIQFRYNDGVLYFRYSNCRIILDSSKRVMEISCDPYPLGHSGFRCWSQSQDKFLG